MVGLIAVALAAVCFLPSSASAQDYILRRQGDLVGQRRTVGIGVDAGYPFTGASLKVFLNQRNALQFGAGFDYGFSAKAEYVGYPFYIGRGADLNVPFYVGIGLGFTLNANANDALLNGGFLDEQIFGGTFPVGTDIVNAHVPIGVAFQLQRAPLDFFIQGEPGVNLLIPPATSVGNGEFRASMRAGLGARLYF
jgi:hypothetical protein